ncbi:MAG: nucleotidyltransferase domain-containing protein [Acidobacteria bacterium]|nr:MAG: nucleotidyltransferase domain-containing protein [Acidobacteriota bacterium]
MPEPAKSQRYRAYREAWRRRDEQAESRREQRRIEALHAARRCGRILTERFGARRVYLFGSVLDPRRFHDASDIDLAVEGLPADRTYWRALTEIWPELPDGIRVDLVPLEQAEPALADEILSSGEILKAE